MLSFDGISCEFLHFNIVYIILNNWFVCVMWFLCLKIRKYFRVAPQDASIKEVFSLMKLLYAPSWYKSTL